MPVEQPSRRLRAFLGSVAILAALLARPLTDLAVHAASSSLHSHILLVPPVVIYLLHSARSTLPRCYRSSPAWAGAFAGAGLVALAAGLAWRASLSESDYLALMTLGVVCLVTACGFAFLGAKWMSAAAFPVSFLFFMLPLPDPAVDWLERALVLGSAEAAALFFKLFGTPLMRHGTVFELPGIVLEVGRECSGIRSSWVLFITSALASYLFLRSPYRRLALMAFVVPLGVLRNGFRVLVIGLLCVHVGPHMIDSPIHRRGGPLFFALSLVPLLGVAWWLRHRELAGSGAPSSGHGAGHASSLADRALR